jgi:hypothetical protein
MRIEDIFGMSGQGDEKRDETEVKKTFVKDGEEHKGLGGVGRREVINGAERREEEILALFMAADGVITTTDPQDQRYPHVAGKDYKGNIVSAGNLHRCMEKGCDRMVSNLSGTEFKPGLWRCTKHYKIYNLRQFVKFFLSPFYTFKEEDLIDVSRISTTLDNLPVSQKQNQKGNHFMP